MNIEEFREYCLSFKGVHDRMPFKKATSEYDRDLLVFYVMDKWFCFVNIDAFDFCNIKCNAGQIEDLLDKYEGVQPGYHMNKKHWISVYFDKDVPDKMIKDLVKQSYEIVVSSLARREGNITSYVNDTITYRYGVLLCQSLFFIGHSYTERKK